MTGPGDITFLWNRDEDIAEAASFAARVIGAETSYISHGEIQTGLSDDGKSWVPDLAENYASDFADRGDRDLLVARNADGTIQAVLVLAFEASERRRFAVIEDMAVASEARSWGIGKAMLDRALERVKERGIEWVFLESGLHNDKAHAFFEREGFSKTSEVFARRL